MKKWANKLNRIFSKKEVQKKNPNQNNNTKNPEKCSRSLAIKEMQIKTTLRFYLTSVGMAIIKEHKQQQMLVRLWRKSNPHTLL
jgi:hypothetical protein